MPPIEGRKKNRSSPPMGLTGVVKRCHGGERSEKGHEIFRRVSEMPRNGPLGRKKNVRLFSGLYHRPVIFGVICAMLG